jgi:hypothetical protein
LFWEIEDFDVYSQQSGEVSAGAPARVRAAGASVAGISGGRALVMPDDLLQNGRIPLSPRPSQ